MSGRKAMLVILDSRRELFHARETTGMKENLELLMLVALSVTRQSTEEVEVAHCAVFTHVQIHRYLSMYFHIYRNVFFFFEELNDGVNTG